MKQIGRFEVKKLLGSGAQGCIYQCFDPQLQRSVAIKLLEGEFGANGEQERRFLDEARAISRIHHPNIVQVFDVGKSGARHYLVFEYIEGQLLSERLKRGQLDLHDALEIFSGMLAGIATLHDAGMVHRDLKPSNVMLGENDLPKIMDFGIAHSLGRNKRDGNRRYGTLRYMAPECIASAETTPRGDVFALGAILYEMVTGRPAFTGKSRTELLQAMQNRARTPPSKFVPGIGNKLEALIDKALAKSPQERYGNAGEMLEALQELRGSDTTGSASSGKGTVEFLIRRMQLKEEFPALAESIRTLNRLSEDADEDLGRLAQVIIRDFALTNKILKVVNSACYGHFSGKIGTISRAIVVLGIKRIKSLAASLILFEHLHDKTRQTALKNEVSASVFSATLARQAAEDSDQELSEEGFLCGMLHNLGRILVTYYLPEENQELERLQCQESLNEELAERRVLGMTRQQLGIAVARHWNFPRQIISGMQRADPAKPGNLKNVEVRLRLIANFANEATRILTDPDRDPEQPLKDLLKAYRMGLAISPKRFEVMVQNARREFSEFSSSLGYTVAEGLFVRRLVGSESRETGPVADTEVISGTARLEAEVVEHASPAPGPLLEVQPALPGDCESLLTEGLQEVTAMLLDEQAKPGQVCNVVLETFYRAVGFQRILLCMQDPRRNEYTARFGFGSHIDKLIEGFHFPVRYSANVFHAALKNGVDVYIADSNDPVIGNDLPDWYRSLDSGGSFIVLPLVVNQKPLGLIYGAHSQPHALELGGRCLNLVKALRNQIMLAFKARL